MPLTSLRSGSCRCRRSARRCAPRSTRNLPVEAADVLRAAGWSCDTVHDEGLAGADDHHVGAACQSEKRVLFTLDLDFADIRAYPPSDYEGIVVLRPARANRRQVLALVARVVPVLASEWVGHQLWIVEPGGVRVRNRNARP